MAGSTIADASLTFAMNSLTKIYKTFSAI